MRNTIGNAITYTIFGESHGKQIGITIDGLSAGVKIKEEYIKKMLELRRPSGLISTARVEEDDFDIVSGLFNGYTTGAPITILIKNKDIKSKDYEEIKNTPRPGHADYTSYIKYKGYSDYRGSGHFSGRITACIVAAGAIIMQALDIKGIKIATHILSCGFVWDRKFKNIEKDIELIKNKSFPVLEEEKEEQMKNEILAVKKEGDSIGGVIETAVFGVSAGIGEPFFDSVESLISHIMFSIPAVKAIEFGKGFNIAQMKGSKANDSFKITKNGTIKTRTNYNGGINGGITNGMPIIYRCAIKPTPSISKEQNTINLITKTNETITIPGRHDPAIIHRAGIVSSCAAAMVIGDLLAIQYGADYFRK